MIAKAKVRFIRISPRKLRDVIGLIRGRSIREALGILENVNKRASGPVLKLLRSAISNAKQSGSNEDNLYISKITADGGPMLKRYRAAAFGRAVMIRHRLSHINVELEEFHKAEPEETAKKTSKQSNEKPARRKAKKTKVKKVRSN